jgi:hypothetical protein
MGRARIREFSDAASKTVRDGLQFVPAEDNMIPIERG